MQTVIGVFGNRSDAHRAISILEQMGYNAQDIGITVKNHTPDQLVGTKGGVAATDTIPGTTAGVIIGILAGILAGLSASSIPWFQTFLMAGPVVRAVGLTGMTATVLSGALTGGLVGGIIGVVAHFTHKPTLSPVEEIVYEGAVLVAVPAVIGEHADQVRNIFQENHADQIRSINTYQNE